MGTLYYLMGKSAVGKDKLYRMLLNGGEFLLEPLVPFTTRPRREREKEGEEYHFVTLEQMEQMEREGKIIERRMYPSVIGPWYYFTALTEDMDLSGKDYLGIGTLDSFRDICMYFREHKGQDGVQVRVVPIYIEADDRIRLERSIHREQKEDHPKYDEVCRRYLADQKDYSEERLEWAGVTVRFPNNGELQECCEKVSDSIRDQKNRKV